MLKQIFNNLFNRKEAKIGSNVDFVNGTLNHNSITTIQAGKCALNFENQIMTIQQGDNILTENMSDVSSMRTWTFKGNVYLAIETKTYNEYKFSFGNVDLWLKSIENYSIAFGIPFEYCGESKENDDKDNE